MKLKKIIAAVAATAMALSISAVSVSAVEPTTVKLYSQNTDSWTLYESAEEYQITGDGDYTFTLDAGGESHYITLYVKDIAAAKGGDDYANAVMTINSITVNGKKLGLTQTEFPLLNEDTSVLDVCFINGWATTYCESDEALMDKDGDSFTFGEAVSTFVIDCTISGLGGGAVANDAAPATEEAAPAADADTTSTETGNTATAVMVSVMAVAVTAAVATKKRK